MCFNGPAGTSPVGPFCWPSRRQFGTVEMGRSRFSFERRVARNRPGDLGSRQTERALARLVARHIAASLVHQHRPTGDLTNGSHGPGSLPAAREVADAPAACGSDPGRHWSLEHDERAEERERD